MFLNLILALVFVASCDAYYVENYPKHNYCTSGKHCKKYVKVFSTPMVSAESVFSYNLESFGFCPPINQEPEENFGQRLFGNKMQTTPYQFQFNADKICSVVCEKSFSVGRNNTLQLLKEGMFKSFEHRWVIDNIPVAWCYETIENGVFCSPGFPMGCYVDATGVQKDACQISDAFDQPDTYYLFNHVNFVIYYHMDGENQTFIVKTTVEPKSYSHRSCEGPVLEIPANLQSELVIPYTYSVKFKMVDDIKWESRWDYIIDSLPHTNILWFSTVNSLVIIAFLSMVLIILSCKKLRSRLNEAETKMIPVESPWEAVRRDIFRNPPKPMLLSVLVGVGTQVLLSSLITIIVGCTGILSPANRGALETAGIISFAVCGMFAGYFTSRLYKTFGGQRRKLNAALVSILIPGFMFLAYLFVNFVHILHHSLAAVDAVTVVQLFLIWFCLLTPLSLCGYYIGQKRNLYKHPVPVNTERRMIPNHSCCKKPIPTIFMGGILPFSCIFIQLFFILNSVWEHQIYYNFGWILVTMIILGIACCEATIILCYLHLSAEDYRWWWRSFITSGFVVFYYLVYTIRFYFTKMEYSGLASFFIFLAWALTTGVLLFLATGAVGFFACYWFLCRIYRKFESEIVSHEGISHKLPMLNTEI